jgi:DNA polymerase III gamma/tau subunit
LSISNNSARILINYLEKIKLIGNEVSHETIGNVCTNIVLKDFVSFTEMCKKNKLAESITLLYEIHDKGYSVMDILDNYFMFVKITDLFSEKQKYNVITLICKYITIFHNIHEDEVELALFTNELITEVL